MSGPYFTANLPTVSAISTLLVVTPCSLPTMPPARSSAPSTFVAISAGAGILGMVADSFLGAWLERRHLVSNDSVNFLSTLIAALATFWFAGSTSIGDETVVLKSETAAA